MPRTNGIDWAALADEIRDGTMQLSELQRIALCRKLTKLVEFLETSLCCHRDLSCGNVFIDCHTWEVCLIDFDSLYHPSLSMPQATTCGTPGYIPHLAWNNGKLDSRRTWCQYVDRFALALLNTEFLLVRPGFKITGEGGIFDQDELRKQSGTGINSVMRALKSKYPYAAQLLDAAIHSSSFSDCPSPHDWNSFYNMVPGLVFRPPSPSDISRVTPEDLAKKLARCKPAIPPWPAPSLDEMTSKTRHIPKTKRGQRSCFDFLSNQWKKVNGIWRIES